ncbi:M56 family metallopeptidase [Actinoplanes bogorensis]|uniref:M56 family metallopeptidase n=1 Tax=Paractinoplanes bogorensis TaxID=1610840 RepID=A0ABS5YJK3_9ACTN|nr:M56 family metallopeptidase [Actinoplanes bogorensis]MBU2663654.1 M56 family metallopeptidase [Actinoplanes bogorensis]
MIDHFLAGVLVCPALVAVTIGLTSARMRPDRAVPFLAWSMAVAALASLANLAVFALKAVAEIPAVGRWFGWSAQAVRDDTAAVPWVSWGSAVALLAAVAAVALVWRRHRRDRAFAEQYADLPTGADGVVLVDDPRALAFALPVRGGRIVVTTAMRAGLTDRQYAALLAHERAHLSAGHHGLVRIARLAAAAHPVFRWLARRVEFLVERAADEQAAAAVGDRHVVARAIGTAALIGAPPVVAGLQMAPARPGVLPQRVASLLRGRPRGSWTLTAAPALVAAFSLVWTGECLYDLGELLVASRL